MEKEKVEEEIKNREFDSITEEFERVTELLWSYHAILLVTNPSLSVEDFRDHLVAPEERFLIDKHYERFKGVKEWFDRLEKERR